MNSLFHLYALLLTLPYSSSENGNNLRDGCGHRPNSVRGFLAGRIVGGELAKPGEFPWQASLYDADRQVCGATVIKKNWVLSAAHCLTEGMTKDTITIVTGDLNKDTSDLGEQSFNVKRLIVHGQYDIATYNNDILLIELSGNITFSDTVQPACLPDTDPAPGKNCFVSGWGDTMDFSRQNRFPRRLQQAKVTIFSQEECNANYTGQITDNMLCAGRRKAGTDSCQGDSGGPLACKNSVTNTFVLHGIVSWGFGCALEGFPGVYTRVKNYRDWILDHINPSISVKSTTQGSFNMTGDPCSTNGSLLIGDYGNFSSPGYANGQYSLNQDCKWIIKTLNGPGTLVRLTFTDFSIEKQVRCIYDYVLVYSGTVDDERSANVSRLLGRDCGNSLPEDFISEESTMTVLFHSDVAQTDKGFSVFFHEVQAANISASGCGGVGNLEQDNGQFTSKNFPLEYGPSCHCQWIISAPEGKIISLTFPVFKLKDSEEVGCNDKVEIYDGSNTSENLLAGFCVEQGRNKTLNSSSNRLTVVFVSDEEGHDTGFRAEYNFVEENPSSGTVEVDYSGVCGVSSIPINADKPASRIYGGYDVNPGSWPWQVSLRDCTTCNHFCGGSILSAKWVLTAAHCLQSTSAILYIVAGDYNRYSVEYSETIIKVKNIIKHPNFNEVVANNNDIALLELEQPLTYSEEVRPLCIPQENSDIEAMNNIECYITGWGETESGNLPRKLQEARIELFNQSLCLDIYTKILFSDNMFCAGNSTGGVDTCQGDSGGPLVCRIRQPYQPWVLYGITSFGYKCGKKEYPGVYTKVPLYTNWILSVTNLTSGPDIIWGEAITFINTSSETTTPVMTTVPATQSVFGESGCGGDYLLDGEMGNISSLFYPDSYSGKLDCEWKILAEPNKTLVLQFRSLDLVVNNYVHGLKCVSDWVLVSEVHADGSPGREFGPYCGTSPPATITTRHALNVKFTAEENGVKTGFFAEYYNTDIEQSGCGGPKYILGPGGSFVTKNHPNRYQSNADCEWIIQASSANNFLQLNFSKFYIEESRRCAYDSVTIIDILDGGNVTYGPFCGNVAPVPITGHSTLYVKFVSDGSINLKGFYAQFAESQSRPYEDSGCGGARFLSDNNTQFSTINYPEPYNANTKCSWLITVDPRSKVELSFNSFEIERSDNCAYDYISMYNGEFPFESKLINKICGYDVGADTFQSISNVMLVVFRSDFSLNKKGMQATFKAVSMTKSKSSGNIQQAPTVESKSEVNNGKIDVVIVNKEEGVLVHESFSEKEGKMDRVANNITCYYRILVKHDRKIQLLLAESFIDLQDDDCISIYDEINTFVLQSERPGQLNPTVQICGPVLNTSSLPNVLTSKSSEISIVFYSDRINSNSSFKINYQTKRDSCGKTDGTHFPWAVSLRSASDFHFCSGVLISQHWILTAASCNFLINKENVALWRGPGVKEEILHVTRVVTHPDYNRDVGLYSNDLALLQIINSEVNPVCLPSKGETNYENCYVLGWSFMDAIKGDISAATLRSTYVDTMPHEQCEMEWFSRITSDMECGRISGNDACQRDVGGPLICRKDLTDPTWKLVSIMNWGPKMCQGVLGSQMPNVFASVSYALDWINNVTDLNRNIDPV